MVDLTACLATSSGLPINDLQDVRSTINDHEGFAFNALATTDHAFVSSRTCSETPVKEGSSTVILIGLSFGRLVTRWRILNDT